jgi:hypothetical protein
VSDVEHAGWAIGGPGSHLRRRRNPLLGILAVLLIIGGSAAAVIGIVRLATEAGPSERRVVARGTVAALEGPATPAARFTTPRAETLTVWLQAGGLSNVRDTIVAGTACRITRSDGTTSELRGSRQGTAVDTDHHATIGETTSSAGANAVSCRHVPFGGWRGRGRLNRERPFVVERGSPGDGLRGLWLLLPGLAGALLGIPVTIRWRAGSVKPV